MLIKYSVNGLATLGIVVSVAVMVDWYKPRLALIRLL
jgi:hypothetical protein